MSEKVLSILIRARDAASAVFNRVGGAAENAGKKLSEADTLAESAQGLKSTLRTAKNIAIAFEVGPVAVDAFNASVAALTGTAEQSAEAQNTLLESIKGFPIVGKLAGEAAEFFGDKVAKLFGKQTTSEMVAEVAAREKALKDFATDLPKIFDSVRKTTNESALLGLLPSDQEIERAKQKYETARRTIFEQKQTTWAARSPLDDKVEEKKAELEQLQKDAHRATIGGVGVDPFFSSGDEAEALKKVDQAKSELQKLIDNRRSAGDTLEALDKQDQQNQKIRDDEIAAANRKKADEARSFARDMENILRDSGHQLAGLNADNAAAILEGDNRGYEARIANLKESLAKQTDAIRDAADKQYAELEKQFAAADALGKQGNADAQKRANELDLAMADVHRDRDRNVDAAGKGNAQEQANARAAQVRDATLASLSAQADAGDAAAKIERDRLVTAREREATEKALAAMGETGLLASTRAGYANITDLNLASSELAILQQRAALGDTEAGINAHNLEMSYARLEAEAKLNAIIAAGNDEQKEAAEMQLGQFKAGAIKEQGNNVRDAGLFVLQQEAALGDKLAEKQLKKIELEKAFNAERIKAQAILSNADATDKQKADAKLALHGMDVTEAAALKRIGAEKPNQLASLVESHTLTGVQASAAQEKDPMQEIGKEQLSAAREMNTLIREYLGLKKQGDNRPQRVVN